MCSSGESVCLEGIEGRTSISPTPLGGVQVMARPTHRSLCSLSNDLPCIVTGERKSSGSKMLFMVESTPLRVKGLSSCLT